MRVLAAYKPSNEGSAVLDAAVEEARLRGAQLVVVRHVRRESSPSGGLIPADPATSSPARTQSGQEIGKLREELEALTMDLESQGVECEAVLLDEGDDAAHQILDLAKRGKIDLIVVGVRHRSRVGKAVLGSEAQQIILNADCPVLAVKGEEAAE